MIEEDPTRTVDGGPPAGIARAVAALDQERRASAHADSVPAAFFRALVEHAEEAVTIVDARGVIVYDNPSMGRVVGRSPGWLRGRSPLEMMPPEDAARAMAILGELQGKPGAQLPGEFRLKHRDGTWRVVSGVATNLLHDPAVRGIVLNYRDITREREVAEARRAASRRRQALLEHIVQAETDERARIASELHDDTIQVMAASLIELDRLEKHLQDGKVESARAAVRTARRTLADATERTRRLTFELRPQQLDMVGLSASIRSLGKLLADETGAEVKVRTHLGRYSPAIETVAYRCIREMLINVRKHAHADLVSIRVTERQRAIRAEIIDNGRGFRMNAPHSRTKRPHMGLEITRERLELAGGALDVESAPGVGTSVRFMIPLR